MENLLSKDFFICTTFEDYNLYLLKKRDLKEGIFTKYHCLFNNLSYDECFKDRNLYEADYSAQSKTGRFLFNKPSIRGRKVGLLLSYFLHTLYIFLLNVCIS